jgi:cobyrinic acid a,c-diamide synthase
MGTTLPRFMLTAPASGGGKTTVTCALLQALVNRGHSPGAFKCGPDLVDPLFHSRIIGVKSGNLDLFLTDEERVSQLLAKAANDCSIAVIEGVMGYYDGLSPDDDTASAHHLARATDTPVILTVDAKRASRSLCALILGFLSFGRPSLIRGVILNRCSPGRYERLKRTIETECGVAVVGYLPEERELAIKSRNLGLVPPDELPRIGQTLARLAELAERCIDIDKIITTARSALVLEAKPPVIKPVSCASPCIAVARDAAFCFHYSENLTLLEDLGARLVFFSPLDDPALPEAADALYLAGGYPELHAQKLSQNQTMLASIRRAALDQKLPTLAECGGFMYLQESIEDDKGVSWPMAGVLKGSCTIGDRLENFGYITLTCEQDGMFLKKGERLPSHEFHYCRTDTPGAGCRAQKPKSTDSYRTVHVAENIFAGFPHLYFYSNIEAARRFVAAAAKHREARLES